MKTLYNIFSMVLLSMLFLTACQDDDNELGLMLDKSVVDFEVTQDYSIDEGGNTVILKNLTPETVAMWDYGTGRSNRATDTVRFPFKGEYTIKFSALTAGGIVAMDPITIQVTEDNVNYISDPLWTLLTGGIGSEKTWILDYGRHGMLLGPLYYYEPLTTWEDFQAGTAKLGWAPAWADNQWIIPEADTASTMTFSLKGGPFLTTHKVSEGIDESGTFYLDAEGRTLSTTDATILRSVGFIGNATNWNDKLVILSLTENQLQVGVRRTNSEGDYLYVWNYISKEYADNYVPVVEEPAGPDEGFEPEFAPGELLDILTDGASSGRLWKIDASGNPIDWIAKGNGWTSSHTDSRDWGWNDSWDAVAENSWILFDQIGGQNYTRNQSGTVTSGSFTINEETNEIILDDNTLIQNTESGLNSTGNTLKVVKAFPQDVENKGIWLAPVEKYDAKKDEWFAFHYILPN